MCPIHMNHNLCQRSHNNIKKKIPIMHNQYQQQQPYNKITKHKQQSNQLFEVKLFLLLDVDQHKNTTMKPNKRNTLSIVVKRPVPITFYNINRSCTFLMPTPTQINPTFITTACYPTGTIQILCSRFIKQANYLTPHHCNISVTLQNPTIPGS